MFQFTGLPPHPLCVQGWVAGHYPDRISPFGNSGINVSVQLPQTYRRYRVLLRHLVPRHSSYTLCSLTNKLATYRVLDLRFDLHRYATFKELSSHLRQIRRFVSGLGLPFSLASSSLPRFRLSASP